MATPENIVEQLSAEAAQWYRDAYRYQTNDPAKRNEFAVWCAEDHKNRTQNALSIWREGQSIPPLISYLQQCRQHAAENRDMWQGFINEDFSSEHQNGYAKWIHDHAHGKYSEALAALAKLYRPHPYAARARWELIFSHDGTASTRFRSTKRVTEGYESSGTLSWEVKAEVSAKVEASTGQLTGLIASGRGHVGGTLRGGADGSYFNRQWGTTERVEEFETTTGAPTYVYQAVSTVNMRHGPPVVAKGAILITSREIH